MSLVRIPSPALAISPLLFIKSATEYDSGYAPVETAVYV